MKRIVLGLVLSSTIGVVNARDLGQWDTVDPAVREWYQALMQPDVPTASCCGEADAYWADEIVWNRRFVDVISATPNGRRVVDLTRFHDTVGV